MFLPIVPAPHVKYLLNLWPQIDTFRDSIAVNASLSGPSLLQIVLCPILSKHGRMHSKARVFSNTYMHHHVRRFSSSFLETAWRSGWEGRRAGSTTLSGWFLGDPKDALMYSTYIRETRLQDLMWAGNAPLLLIKMKQPFARWLPSLPDIPCLNS